jgi:quercetin dioxygenase-like cupin family protein
MALKIIRTDAALPTTPEPGMIREVLAYSDQLMLVRHHFEQGWVGAPHSHPHHQLVYVLSGSIRIVAGEEEAIANAGDSFVVDGGVQHQAFALEASEVLDVFTPRREDYAL